MRWLYFSLITSDGEKEYQIIDEDGVILTEDGTPVEVDSFEEAEDYLVEHDIRGTIRGVIK